jgi:hypothetical protein
MSNQNASYLDSFLEDVVGLRGDLRKQLGLMRELDEECEALTSAVETDTQQYLSSLGKITRQKHPKLPSHTIAQLQAIREKYNKCLALGDEKVSIAAQVYEIVDQHIRHMDADLEKFSAEIGDVTSTRERAEKHVSTSEKGVSRKRSASAALVEEIPPTTGDMPIDSNEPRYCICNQVSYGEMVACDNEDCPHGEWFHLPCVGLKTAPTGQWFCPGCREDGMRPRPAKKARR